VLIGRANWWPTLWGRRAIPLSIEDEIEFTEIEVIESGEIEDTPDGELLAGGVR